MAPRPRFDVLATAALTLAGAFALNAMAQTGRRPGAQAQQGPLSGREQREELRRASALLRAAARLAEDGRNDDAKSRFEEAQAKVEAVAANVDERLTRMFQRTREDVAEAHASLTAAGVPLDPLGGVEPGGGAADPRGRAEPMRRGPASDGGVSFASQVAPLLMQKCGNCHVNDERGGVSFASYNALAQGGRARQVIVPGAAARSLMIQAIRSGDMPRGGGSVAPEELQLLESWINEGARFDGDNPGANLARLRPARADTRSGDQAAPMAQPQVTRPTGGETVSFAMGVAPTLISRCAQCHVEDDQGGLRMSSFAQLLAGGDGGPIITPGDPDQSPLVRRLRGDDTPRMPLRGPALPAEQIETIATWIREGAKFDGDRPSDTLERTLAVGMFERLTPDGLNQVRQQGALTNWRYALPDTPSNTFESERVLVVGAAPAEELADVANAAEATAGEVLKVLGKTAEEPLGKARVTLFVFDDRIDYSEFATMVEKRRLPEDAAGHWRYKVSDSYVCLPLDPAAEGVDAFSLAHQLAAAHLAERTLDRAPDWLVDGTARVAAAQTDPRDPRVRAWLDEAKQLAAGMQQPDDFMTGKLAPEKAGVVGFSFAAPLMRQEAKFLQVFDAIAEGKSVDEAFQATYGRPTGQLAELWRASLVRGR